MRFLTDEEKVILGEGAKRILEDEAVQFAFESMRGSLLAAIDSMRTDSPDDVMAIVRQLRVIRVVQDKLKGYVSEADYIQRGNNG